MATLVSPGVSVTVIDESFYTSSTQGTVPFIMIATAENKINAAGTEIAAGTKKENANKLYQITSQRELLATFGDPVFKNVNGTPVHGDPLNEYGLLTAFSYLGSSNRAYVMRADVDLSQLEPSVLPPKSKPANDTYWLKSDNLDPALYEYVDGKWVKQDVYVGNSYKLLAGANTGAVQQIIITTNGTGYSLNQVVTCSGGSGAGATVKITSVGVGGAALTAIPVSGGAGYNVSETLNFDVGGAQCIINQTEVGNGKYGDSRDVVVENVPSNYKYVILATQYPAIELLSLHGIDISNLDFSQYIGVYNFAAKIVNGQFLWLSSNGLFGGIYPFDDDKKVMFSDVYPSKRADNTALQGGDVWFNTSKNVYDLKQYDSTTDTYATIKYPINVSKNAGLSYYGGIDKVKLGDVIAVSGNKEILSLAWGDNFSCMNFYEWKDAQYKMSEFEVDPTLNLDSIPDTATISFHTFENDVLTTTPITVSGDIHNMLSQINSNSTLAGYGVSVTYNAELKKFKFETIYGNSYLFSFQDDTESMYFGFLQSRVPYWGFVVDGWKLIDSTASINPPEVSGVDLTYWYDESFKVDILVNNGTGDWVDPTFATYLQPSEPSAATNGDLWIDTTKVKEYPYIQRKVAGIWELVDNTDQTTPDGIVFADARIEPNAAIDSDAPDALRYPDDMLLFNTRYSSRNVKQYRKAYLGAGEDRWVSVSGLKQDGSPYMGQDAVRRMIAKQMQSALLTNETIRSEDVYYNLIAAPAFPEVIDEMISLNVDRGETAFVLGDCPFDLKDNTNDIVNWVTNASAAGSNGQDGLVTANENLAVYYPCGLTTNVDGSEVVVPPSHMALRTIAYSDSVSYPWFAPAGLQRGIITNATNVGYVSDEGEFTPVSLSQGLRDVMYLNGLNPIRQMTNVGPVIWGQKTRSPVSSALDRINVARLVNYIRFQAPKVAEPFLFEQNDPLTRKAAKSAMDGFLSEIASLRGIYDWLAVCDDSNNTPARIDRNELWIDVLIKPEKTIEFIYIPIRLRKTGDDLAL